jgi:hypothetical protein
MESKDLVVSLPELICIGSGSLPPTIAAAGERAGRHVSQQSNNDVTPWPTFCCPRQHATSF